jgi:hypothetical protein
VVHDIPFFQRKYLFHRDLLSFVIFGFLNLLLLQDPPVDNASTVPTLKIDTDLSKVLTLRKKFWRVVSISPKDRKKREPLSYLSGIKKLPRSFVDHLEKLGFGFTGTDGHRRSRQQPVSLIETGVPKRSKKSAINDRIVLMRLLGRSALSEGYPVRPRTKFL